MRLRAPVAALLFATVLQGASPAVIPAAASLAAPAAMPAPAAEKPAVRILAPTGDSMVLGRTEIRLQIEPPPGATILKVELYGDDRLLVTLLDAPWSYDWEAGDTLRARTVKAKVFASNGAVTVERVTTRQIVGAQRARVTLVQVFATVRDEQGSYIQNLDKDEFIVTESGRKQEIAVFSPERKPAHLVLVLDTSASMKQDGRLDTAREAAIGFIDALEPEDSAAVVAFSDAPMILQSRTSDKKILENAILTTEAKGGTALYDAILSAVTIQKEIEGKKAIVLLSDGRDESASGLGPGSAHTYEEALEAVLKSETAVYVIATGEKIEEELDYNHRRTLGEILGTFAARSGGRAFFIKRAGKLKDAYHRIEDELRHQYTIGYYPSADDAKIGWRPIEVMVKRPRARVTARTGYYAK